MYIGIVVGTYVILHTDMVYTIILRYVTPFLYNISYERFYIPYLHISKFD